MKRVLIVLLLLASPWARAEEARLEISRERLEAAFAEARAAVESRVEAKLDPALELKLVESDVIAEHVAAENLPAIRLRQRDEEKARAEADAAGEVLAQMALAKYAWSTRELLVVPATWESHADLLGRPQLTSDGALRAVMVHELVHALDDARFDFGQTIAKLPTLDAVLAFNAVIEGHAQHVTRAVCAKQGWNEGFDAFADSIGAIPEVPPELGELTKVLMEIASVSLTSAYEDGERFIAELERAGSRDAIVRAFREPPSEMEFILHPEWFLDPATRPKLCFDLERGLAVFAERLPADTWTTQRLTLSSAQVGVALALLPEQTVERIVDSAVTTRVLIAQPTAAPASKNVLLGVIEFRSDDEALFYAGAARELARIKAEKMKEGILSILDSKVTGIDDERARGFAQRLRVRAGLEEIDVHAVTVARGHIVSESVFSAEQIADEEHVRLAIAVLDAVRRVEEPTAVPPPPEKAGE